MISTSASYSILILILLSVFLMYLNSKVKEIKNEF